METLKKYIGENKGLGFIYENLKINSSAGRKKMLAQKFFTKEFELKMELETVDELIKCCKHDGNSKQISLLQTKLSQLNDIHQSIINLTDSQTLDDVELFEIKNFCMVGQSIFRLLDEIEFDILPFFELNEVIEILDPEKSGIQSFYIYSAYDSDLARLRKEYEIAKQQGDDENAEKIRRQCIDIEDKIRARLSHQLKPSARKLDADYNQLAYFDCLLAKAILAIDLNLTKPEIADEKTVIKGAFNPLVKRLLNDKGEEFQAIDIEFSHMPNLITGANMSGKTVVLKTISLIQYMFQYGFFVPAKEARICLVDEIMQSIGDAQSEVNGLSSFAIEMLNIDRILKTAKEGRKILAVVDELARTTNPEEGKALVNAFIKVISKYNVFCLITTHYSGINSNCRRLIVKGLKINDRSKITPQNINQYMDYSLVEIFDDRVPTEGLTIAEIFDVDKDFIEEAKKNMKN